MVSGSTQEEKTDSTAMWEILLTILVAGIALIPFAFNLSRFPMRATGILLATLLIAATVGFAWKPQQAESRPTTIRPKVVNDREDYVSSNACRKCHPGNYDSWHRTFHRTMTQFVTPETMIPPIDDFELESNGLKCRIERNGDEFWVELADPEWDLYRTQMGLPLDRNQKPPVVRRKLVLSTGSHHLQTYWFQSSNGLNLLKFPWVFLISEHRWVPTNDVFLVPPNSEGNNGLWSNECNQCHTVGGKPGFDSVTGHWFSEVAELGIACEACHGPAEKHVRHHRSAVNRYRRHLSVDPDPTIVNPLRSSQKVSSQICGACHSYRELVDYEDYKRNGIRFRPGDELEDSIRIVKSDGGIHRKNDSVVVSWDDGTFRVAGDEYNAMIASECYQQGNMTCLSCHSMHASDPNDQLAARMDGNQACLQCHKNYSENIEAHTHHAAESSGSQCYNCHMPHTSYGLLTAQHSHQITSPGGSLTTVSKSRPNACNLCHLDQTVEWTANRLSEWYGTPKQEFTKEETQTAASLLWLLRGDAFQRVIIAWHFGWDAAQTASGKDWQAAFLGILLDDPYAAVRFVAYKSLRSLPEFDDFEYDYVDSKTHRSQAKKRAMERWQAHGELPPTQASRRRLLDGNTGKLRLSEIDRLLQVRDDTPIVSPE